MHWAQLLRILITWYKLRGFVVTLTQNHRIDNLLNIIKIFKEKKIEYHRIVKFGSNIDFEKRVILSK